MSYLKVTQFEKYQHYKNRKPVWVKFHVALLDPHHPINRLPIPTRLLFDRLLLLAAEWDNAIPKIPELIASHTGIPLRECREGIDELLSGRWLSETQTNRRASKHASKSARTRVRVREELKPRAVTSKETSASAPETNGTAPVEQVREQILRSLRDAAA